MGPLMCLSHQSLTIVLPATVLEILLSFLTLRERVDTSLVSRAFHDAYNNGSHWSTGGPWTLCEGTVGHLCECRELLVDSPTPLHGLEGCAAGEGLDSACAVSGDSLCEVAWEAGVRNICPPHFAPCFRIQGFAASRSGRPLISTYRSMTVLGAFAFDLGILEGSVSLESLEIHVTVSKPDCRVNLNLPLIPTLRFFILSCSTENDPHPTLDCKSLCKVLRSPELRSVRIYHSSLTSVEDLDSALSALHHLKCLVLAFNNESNTLLLPRLWSSGSSASKTLQELKLIGKLNCPSDVLNLRGLTNLLVTMGGDRLTGWIESPGLRTLPLRELDVTCGVSSLSVSFKETLTRLFQESSRIATLRKLCINTVLMRTAPEVKSGVIGKLRNATHLVELSLELPCIPFVMDGIFAELSKALTGGNNLTRLVLGLGHSQVSVGAFSLPLQISQRCKSLVSLDLNMNSTQLEGGRFGLAVGYLASLPVLHTLNMNLSRTSLGAAACSGIAHLGKSSLRSLRLSLQADSLKDGVGYFARFGDIPFLKTLMLDLNGNEITCDSVRCMMEGLVKAKMTLRSLILILSANAIGDSGAKHLHEAMMQFRQQ